MYAINDIHLVPFVRISQLAMLDSRRVVILSLGFLSSTLHRTARPFGEVYPKIFAKAIDILDVHDMSPGAARLALSWWLANVAGQQVGSMGENVLKIRKPTEN